jgi:hypothetical protein
MVMSRIAHGHPFFGHELPFELNELLFQLEQASPSVSLNKFELQTSTK